MKWKPVLSQNQRVHLVYRDRRLESLIIDVDLVGLNLKRSRIVEAQDMRTFWGLAKDLNDNPIVKIWKKSFF